MAVRAGRAGCPMSGLDRLLALAWKCDGSASGQFRQEGLMFGLGALDVI